jgi:hypothetical protein
MINLFFLPHLVKINVVSSLVSLFCNSKIDVGNLHLRNHNRFINN